MIIRQIFVGLLASLMLIASTGATLHQMVCLHSGNAEYSFDDIDCCKGNDEKESVKRSCCEFFSITFQTDDLANVNSELNLNLLMVQNVSIQIQEELCFIEDQLILNQYNLPPPYKLPIYKEVQSFLC